MWKTIARKWLQLIGNQVIGLSFFFLHLARWMTNRQLKTTTQQKKPLKISQRNRKISEKKQVHFIEVIFRIATYFLFLPCIAFSTVFFTQLVSKWIVESKKKQVNLTDISHFKRKINKKETNKKKSVSWVASSLISFSFWFRENWAFIYCRLCNTCTRFHCEFESLFFAAIRWIFFLIFKME